MRNCLRLAAALSCAALTGCSSSSTGSDGTGSDPFTSNTIGKYQAFTDGGGTWSVANGVLSGRGTAEHNVLVRTGTRMKTGWVEAKSDAADDGGLVLRFVDNQNYVLLAFRDDAQSPWFYGNNLALYTRVGGDFDELASLNVAWPRGTPHTVRLEAGDGELLIYFDGTLLEAVPMPADTPAEGAIGVRHYGEDPAWTTRIDELRWDLDG
ncbi:hypothetical protein [Longimicrobium sp.]|uniref:hypothetical protein n=1 Tax=Longimicrobium sp. TaxID=2029185 RepID=UPI002EDAAF03